MAASYPAGFDTLPDPSSNLSGPPLHSTIHNSVNDVVEAIEAELGLNPSGVAATVAAVTAVTTWTALTYTNSWVDYGAPNQVGQYRKIGDIVYLRGVVKNGTLNTAAFTLPAGFRPPATVRMICSDGGLLVIDSAGVTTLFALGNTIIGFLGSFSVTA